MRVYWVRSNLAFGRSINTWRDVDCLKNVGITHIINLKKNRNGKKVRAFKSLWLPFKDDKKPRPSRFYRAALRFYQKATRDKASRVFIMCRYGRCRSASLAYFLLRSSGMAASKAERTIRVARSNAMLPKAYRDSCELFLERSHCDLLNSR